MPATVVKSSTLVREPLPAGRMLGRVFWLLVIAVVGAFAYSLSLLDITIQPMTNP